MDDGERITMGTAIREYRDLLVALDIPHEWHIFPGAHDSTYWSPLVSTYLRCIRRIDRTMMQSSLCGFLRTVHPGTDIGLFDDSAYTNTLTNADGDLHAAPNADANAGPTPTHTNTPTITSTPTRTLSPTPTLTPTPWLRPPARLRAWIRNFASAGSTKIEDFDLPAPVTRTNNTPLSGVVYAARLRRL